MRVLTLAILFLFTFVAASAQSKFALKPQGELRIDDYDDRIITERLLPSENKLLFVGTRYDGRPTEGHQSERAFYGCVWKLQLPE